MEAVPSNNCCCVPNDYPLAVRATFAMRFSELIRAELPFNVNRMLLVTLSLPMLFLVFIGMKVNGVLGDELFLGLVMFVIVSFHTLLVIAACVDLAACRRAYRTLSFRYPSLMERIRASHAALWRSIDGEDRDEPVYYEEPLKMAA